MAAVSMYRRTRGKAAEDQSGSSRADRRGLYTSNPPTRPFAARETGNMTTFDRPAACLTCQPFERPTRPTHRAAESQRAHHAARHGHGRLVFRWPQDLGAPSSRAGRPGAARPSQPVDAGASTLRPFLPHTPSFPGSSRRPSAALRVRAPLSGLTASGGYSPRLPDAGTRCRDVGETGAPLPSLRSGRLRRPARAERDSSRRRTSPRRAGGI